MSDPKICDNCQIQYAEHYCAGTGERLCDECFDAQMNAPVDVPEDYKAMTQELT